MTNVPANHRFTVLRQDGWNAPPSTPCAICGLTYQDHPNPVTADPDPKHAAAYTALKVALLDAHYNTHSSADALARATLDSLTEHGYVLIAKPDLDQLNDAFVLQQARTRTATETVTP